MGWFDRRSDAAPEVGPVEAARLVDEGAVMVDVRRADEWQAGRAPQARHIPMEDLGRRLAELPRDRSIVAVCRSGRRSGMVADQLRAHGYDVLNLQGGMLAWAGSGYPVVASGGRDGRVL
ncbi:MAG TPA: rhodanese-like domain-containing protein [Jiangellales bacterium]|nr:rhodanese-like domain-containing protein [Jiangellales bacterium]